MNFIIAVFKDNIFLKPQESTSERLTVWFDLDLAETFGWTYKCVEATNAPEF